MLDHYRTLGFEQYIHLIIFFGSESESTSLFKSPYELCYCLRIVSPLLVDHIHCTSYQKRTKRKRGRRKFACSCKIALLPSHAYSLCCLDTLPPLSASHPSLIGQNYYTTSSMGPGNRWYVSLQEGLAQTSSR